MFGKWINAAMLKWDTCINKKYSHTNTISQAKTTIPVIIIYRIYRQLGWHGPFHSEYNCYMKLEMLSIGLHLCVSFMGIGALHANAIKTFYVKCRRLLKNATTTINTTKQNTLFRDRERKKRILHTHSPIFTPAMQIAWNCPCIYTHTQHFVSGIVVLMFCTIQHLNCIDNLEFETMEKWLRRSVSRFVLWLERWSLFHSPANVKFACNTFIFALFPNSIKPIKTSTADVIKINSISMDCIAYMLLSCWPCYPECISQLGWSWIGCCYW